MSMSMSISSEIQQLEHEESRLNREAQEHDTKLKSIDRQLAKLGARLYELRRMSLTQEEIDALSVQVALPRVKEARRGMEKMFQELSTEIKKATSSLDKRILEAKREVIVCQMRLNEYEGMMPKPHPKEPLLTQKDLYKAQIRILDLQMEMLESRPQSQSQSNQRQESRRHHHSSQPPSSSSSSSNRHSKSSSSHHAGYKSSRR